MQIRAAIILLCILALFTSPNYVCAKDRVKNDTSLINFIGTSQLNKYLNKKKWNELFPHRNLNRHSKIDGQNEMYSYNSFLKAAKKFPQFLGNKNDTINKRELSAFLANIAQETSGGWDNAPDSYFTWGLYFTEEQNCNEGCQQYSDTTNKKYPPFNGCSYHGRGPKQLSWNYNYGQFSEAYFGDKDSLLKHPELLIHDAVLAFSSAIWFWMQSQKPKPSCHDIITGNWIPSHIDSSYNRLPGFGATVNVINGGIECNINEAKQTTYRYNYYLFFCKYFNVVPGPNLKCSNQKPFNIQK